MKQIKDFDINYWYNNDNNALQPSRKEEADANNDIPHWNTHEEVEDFVNSLCDSRICITDAYHDWLKTGFALADCLGEDGRELFHRLSAMSDKYNERECDYKYSSCLRSTGQGVHIESLYWLAKQAGFDLAEYARERNLAFGDYRFEDVNLQELKEEVGTNGTNGTNGTPHVKSCKNNNLLIYNTLDNSEEKTHAVPKVPKVPTVPTLPTFSDQIDDNDWCDYLQPIVAKMKDAESRDKMILAALTVGSAMMPNYYGRYGNKDVYPNLYMIISGMSASGKGEVGLAQKIIEPLLKENLKNFEQAKAEYIVKKAEWDELGKSRKEAATRGDAPLPPEFHSLMIPADSTEAAALRELYANEGQGLIFDSEGSVVRKALSSDYKDYSAIILKAFHHEVISVARIRDNIRYDIASPRLGILLTCTPGELPKLFPSWEDGLGTRFLFYTLQTKLQWIDQLADTDQLDYVFLKLGERSLDIFHQLQALGERRIKFELTDSQRVKFNDFFAEILQEQFANFGDGIISFIKRMGLSAFRLAMVLTMLRRHSERDGVLPLFTESEQTLTCDDKDFDIMLAIMQTLISHTSAIFATLDSNNNGTPAGNTSSQMTNPEVVLFNALPDQFTSEDVKAAAESLNISERMARKYIAKFINKYRTVERVKYGVYKKITPNDRSNDAETQCLTH